MLPTALLSERVHASAGSLGLIEQSPHIAGSRSSAAAVHVKAESFSSTDEHELDSVADRFNLNRLRDVHEGNHTPTLSILSLGALNAAIGVFVKCLINLAETNNCRAAQA